MNALPVSVFYDYCNERYAIFLKRQAGLPPPWTEDPILREWKFCCVHREVDRHTQWLFKNLYQPALLNKTPFDLILFNVCCHREFNWRPTSELLGFLKHWEPAKVARNLRARANIGEQIFTNAHLVRSENGRLKIESVVDILTPIWTERKELVRQFREWRSMEQAHDRLCVYRFLGEFLCYQFLMDLQYTPILSDATDLRTWAAVGPGALKGVRLIYPDATMGTALARMHDILATAPKYASPELQKFRVPMTINFVEHNSCELYKYIKTKRGEGTPRNRYKRGGY